MEVSINGGTPKSSILIVFSLINHPFWGTPIYRNPHMVIGWVLRFLWLPNKEWFMDKVDIPTMENDGFIGCCHITHVTGTEMLPLSDFPVSVWRILDIPPLTGAFHAGNGRVAGGCWDYHWLLWIIPSFPKFSTSKSSIYLTSCIIQYVAVSVREIAGKILARLPLLHSKAG